MQEQFHRIVPFLVPQVVLISPPYTYGILALHIAFILTLTDDSHVLRSIGIHDIVEVIVGGCMEHEVGGVVPVLVNLFIYDSL